MSTKPTQPIEYKLSPSETIAAPKRNRLVSTLAWIGKAMMRYLETRQAIRKLSQLDDHLLSDIGLSRGDVRSAVAYGAGADATTRLRILAVERRAKERQEYHNRYISGQTETTNGTNLRSEMQKAGV